MIIMDISIFVDILYMKTILLVITTVVLLSSATSASAAQFLWDARSETTQVIPKFTFQRTISIEYPDDSMMAEELNEVQKTEYHVADSSTNGMPTLVEKINKSLENAGSHVRISDVSVEYTATLVGRQNSATIDYKLVLVPTITDFVIREYTAESPALLDVSWRAIKVDGPIMLFDDTEINMPVSFLKKHFPSVYGQISGTDAETILSSSLLDASGVGLPLAKWHSLFDPTPIISDAEKFGFKGDIVTTYSMGESRIGVTAKEKVLEASFSGYKIKSIEAADSATIFVPGYASPDVLLGLEVIGISPVSLGGFQFNDQGQFPVLIIYGMAGIAAASAGCFFWWSGKKAKRDASLGQSGIDPVYLRGVHTSLASGGYHTNRGEAHLMEENHDQTKSVYKNDGAMPKGWK